MENSSAFAFKMPKMSELTDKVGDMLGIGEFSNPIGEMILHATAETLIAADWALNMDVADLINATYGGANYAAKAVQRRLKSENSKVVSLTLTLCDVLVKNCNRNLHGVFGSQEFLANFQELVERKDITPEVRTQALELVQGWGSTFVSSRSLYFSECYLRMKAYGIIFPPKQEEDNINIALDTRNAPSSTTLNLAQEIMKLKLDLVCVQEKVELCQEMMQHSPGIDYDEILRELIGFLEACKPRLYDLIQAGSAGTLDSDIMEACLKINDALLRTLTAEREGTPITAEKIKLGFGLQAGQEGISPCKNPLDRPEIANSFTIADEDGEEEYESLSQPQLRLTTTNSELGDQENSNDQENSKDENAANHAQNKSTLNDDLEEFESFLNSRP